MSKRKKRILLVVLVLVVALVAAAPTLISTSVGCRAAEAYLSLKLHRSVTLGRLTVGYFHGTRVEDLRIGTRPGFGDKPFVQLKTLTCDTTLLGTIFSNRFEEVHIEQLEVSVVRLADGRLSIEDLIRKDDNKDERQGDDDAPPAKAAGLLAAASPADEADEPPQITVPVVAAGGRFHYRDEQFQTDVLLEEFALDMLYDRGKVEVTRCTGRLNDGELSLTSTVDLCVRPQPFDAIFKLTGCKASSDLSGLGLQVPLLYNPFGKTSGTINIDVSLSGSGFQAADLQSHLKGRSLLEVRDLRLEGSKMLGKVLEPLKMGNALTFDVMRAQSVIADGRVTSSPPDGEIRASHQDEVTLLMTGWTDMDGRMDYRLAFSGKKIEQSSYGALAQQFVQPRLTGTLAEPQVALGLPGTDESLNLEDLKSKLKDLKKLKDLFK